MNIAHYHGHIELSTDRLDGKRKSHYHVAISMYNATSPLFTIAAIILIAVIGGGFAWTYHDVITARPLRMTSTVHPHVLGATTGAIEQPLAGDKTKGGLFPSEINRLFLQYCNRPATLGEMDRWTSQPATSLRAAIPAMSNCQ